MNINIEKIENGYIVVLGAKRTFCSEAMGICGLLAEWAQSEVERLDRAPDSASKQAAMAMVKAQAQLIEPLRW